MQNRKKVGMRSNAFGKIMVATDGSEAVRRAVDSAVELAKLSEAKLYAVYVISTGFFPIALPIDAEWKKDFLEQLVSEGRQATAYVEQVGKAANLKVESIILQGSPAEEILNFADKNDIDLIILGTYGMGGITRFLLGSVTENVVRHAKNAVLIVREETAKIK